MFRLIGWGHIKIFAVDIQVPKTLPEQQSKEVTSCRLPRVDHQRRKNILDVQLMRLDLRHWRSGILQRSGKTLSNLCTVRKLTMQCPMLMTCFLVCDNVHTRMLFATLTWRMTIVVRDKRVNLNKRRHRLRGGFGRNMKVSRLGTP